MSLEGMERFDYRAVAIGPRDLPMQAGTWDRTVGSSSLPFVSVNLRAHDSGERIVPAYRIVTLPLEDAGSGDGVLRIGLVGVTAAQRETIAHGPAGRTLVVGDAAAELAAILPEVRQQCDFVVVVTSALDTTIRELITASSGVDLLLAAANHSWSEPRVIGGTPVYSSGDQGKQIAWVAIHRTEAGFRPEIRRIPLMVGGVPEDPETYADVHPRALRILRRALTGSDPITSFSEHFAAISDY